MRFRHRIRRLAGFMTRPTASVAAVGGAAALVLAMAPPAAEGAAKSVVRAASAARAQKLAGQRKAAAKAQPATAKQTTTQIVQTQAVASKGIPPIGTLFALTSSGALNGHFCTATVINSPAGNLVLTAAHCMAGRSPGAVAFVPGYAGGKSPHGAWQVTQVFVDQAWASDDDPDDDFAFLEVSQAGTSQPVQAFTGGEALAAGTPAAQLVTVIGYPDNDSSPISCVNRTKAFSATQMEFGCGGFTGGTSGSPLLSGSTVIGVIGGYERGGSTSSVSYAARFGANMTALYQTATAGS